LAESRFFVLETIAPFKLQTIKNAHKRCAIVQKLNTKSDMRKTGK